MNRTLSFLFAAAFGATLGALTALELAPLFGITNGFAATLGIIVGGLTGYIAVDFRQFCAGVVYAVKAAYSKSIEAYNVCRYSPRENKLEACFTFVAFSFFMSYLLIPLFFHASQEGMGSRFLWIMGISTFSAIALMSYNSVDWRRANDFRDLAAKIMAYWVSPIGIAHFVFLKALPWLVVGLYKIVRWLVRQTIVFGKTLFIAVHSERRVLCCLDAMLGTLVGYYLGSWPAGTVAGLAFALVSYELISKRWLKLQTA